MSRAELRSDGQSPACRFTVPLLPVEHFLFQGDIVSIGQFSCRPVHALFRSSGPATTWCVAFPRRSVWIRHPDGESFVADATLATLYNRGDEYERGALDEAGDDSDWIAIAPDVLVDIVGEYDEAAFDRADRPFDGHRAPCDSATYVRQRQLVETLKQASSPDALLVEERALRIVDRLLRNRGCRPQSNARAATEVAEATRAVLAVRFRTNLRLRDVAAAVGVSPFYLCHAFRSATGTTVARYRDQLRVRASLEMIASTQRGFVDIAFELGYSSHSHFTASFRRAFHTTPSAFRRSINPSRFA